MQGAACDGRQLIHTRAAQRQGTLPRHRGFFLCDAALRRTPLSAPRSDGRAAVDLLSTERETEFVKSRRTGARPARLPACACLHACPAAHVQSCNLADPGVVNVNKHGFELFHDDECAALRSATRSVQRRR